MAIKTKYHILLWPFKSENNQLYSIGETLRMGEDRWIMMSSVY